jgi:putative ATP-dependent endonuclease of OLD family
LGLLGAKEKVAPLQVFATTHSPVALKELNGGQLFVIRNSADKHEALQVGSQDEIQSTIRLYPEGFLAHAVCVCEGASEVGFIRGLDTVRVGAGKPSFEAQGVALVDANGVEHVHKRANAFRALRYATAILRDDDIKPDAEVEKSCLAGGAKLFSWSDGCALEDELFLSLSEGNVQKLLAKAIDLHGEPLVDDHIKSASSGKLDLAACKAKITDDVRQILGKAARTRKAGWFKSVTWMEQVATEIVAPNLQSAENGFRERVEAIFAWMDDARR